MDSISNILLRVNQLSSVVNDESAPFKSIYEARDILSSFLVNAAKFKNDNQPLPDEFKSIAIASFVLGNKYFETEEFTTARQILIASLFMFISLPDRLNNTPYVIEVCNLIGAVYMRLGESLKGFNYFRRAQIWYQEAREQGKDIPELETSLTLINGNPFWDEVERQYTSTVFSLAQAYQPINQAHLAGLYASETLSRQICLNNSFEDVDVASPENKFDRPVWIRNCCALSAFYENNDLELSSEYLLFAGFVVAKSNPIFAKYNVDLSSPMPSGTHDHDDATREIIAARELIGEAYSALAVHFIQLLKESCDLLADPVLNGKRLANKMLQGLKPGVKPTPENKDDPEENGKLPVPDTACKCVGGDSVVKAVFDLTPLGEVLIDSFSPELVTAELLGASDNPDSVRDWFQLKAFAGEKLNRVCQTAASRKDANSLEEAPLLDGYFIPPIVLPAEIHRQVIQQMQHYRQLFFEDCISEETRKNVPTINYVWPKLFETIALDHQARNKLTSTPEISSVETAARVARVYDEHPWLARNALQLSALQRIGVHFADEACNILIMDGWTSRHLDAQLLKAMSWRYLANVEDDVKRWKSMMTRRVTILQTKIVAEDVNAQSYLRIVKQTFFELGHSFHELHEFLLSGKIPLTQGRPCWIKRLEVVRTKGVSEVVPEPETITDEKIRKQANEYALKCAAAYGKFSSFFVVNNNLEVDDEEEGIYLTAKLSEARMFLKVGLTKEEKFKATQQSFFTYRFLMDAFFSKRPHSLSPDFSFRDEARLTAEMCQMLPRRLKQMMQ